MSKSRIPDDVTLAELAEWGVKHGVRFDPVPVEIQTEPIDPIYVEFGRMSADLGRIITLHSERVFGGDGYSWSVCAEDRQAWPCATIRAISKPLGGDSTGTESDDV